MATKRSRVFDSHEPPGFDLRSGILETAQALGMSPVDLATLIHYESGFDPNVWGGAGGRHYGSIQFGPNERAQYGVRIGDPSSQFGANGAIVKYMLDRGFKPGMSILDAYSTINAGRPGLYNASDTAAGGQPGNVRDKVTGQMADDRKAAMEFLNMSAENYDPRADTPSTGHPVGSTLPGPPPDPYAQPVTGGAGGAFPTYTQPAAADKGNFGKRFGTALAEGEGGAGMEYKPTTVPELPKAALFQGQPTTIGGDPQETELRKKRLAEIMARLNTGKLTV